MTDKFMEIFMPIFCAVVGILGGLSLSAMIIGALLKGVMFVWGSLLGVQWGGVTHWGGVDV